MPYYSEIYFTPVNARYFRLVESTGTFASLADIDILQNTPTPTSVTLTPYYQVNGGTWENGTQIVLPMGSSVKVGPQPSNGIWFWTGPGGFKSTNREFTVANINASNIRCEWC